MTPYPLRCQLGARRVHIAYQICIDPEDGALAPDWWPIAPSPPHLRFSAADAVMIQGLIVADYLVRARAQ
jgi:hypothetical protein